MVVGGKDNVSCHSACKDGVKYVNTYYGVRPHPLELSVELIVETGLFEFGN